MQWVTTTAFLERLRDTQNSAWESLAGQFRTSIVRYAGSLGLPREEAEDVAQETLAAFAQAYRRGDYARDKGRLSSWLFGIAHRQIHNQARKLARRREAEPAGNRTGFWDDLPDESAARETWDRTWEEMVLEHCLRRVRPSFQESTWSAFERVVLESQQPAAAAAALGITRNAVFVAKHRVLKRLREVRREFEEQL